MVLRDDPSISSIQDREQLECELPGLELLRLDGRLDGSEDIYVVSDCRNIGTARPLTGVGVEVEGNADAHLTGVVVEIRGARNNLADRAPMLADTREGGRRDRSANWLEPRSGPTSNCQVSKAPGTACCGCADTEALPEAIPLHK